MARPDLSDPVSKRAYRAELRSVALGWRGTGLALVALAAAGLIWTLMQERPVLDDPIGLVSVVLLAIGWAVLGIAVTIRTRHHIGRMREED